MNRRRALGRRATTCSAWATVLIALGAVLACGAAPFTVQAGPVGDAFVVALYEIILGRAPDSEGYDSWRAFLAHHPDVDTARSMIRSFFDSAEFEAIPITPSTYATKLYRAVLGRAPDPATHEQVRAAVLRQLNSMLPAFVQSDEFQRSLMVSPPSAYVERLYLEGLGRPPSSVEVTNWGPALANGAYLAVAEAVFGSEEYTEIPRTLPRHVEIHYRAILNRQPSDEEVRSWLDVLRARLGFLLDMGVDNNAMQVAARIQDVPPSSEGVFLTQAEVAALVTGAAAAVNSTSMVIVVVDRMGNPLAVFRQPDAPATTTGDFGAQVDTNELALSLARAGAFFSNNQAPLSSRTIRFISGVHFPAGIRNKPNGAQYGIENTNRGCSLNTAFNPGKTIVPARALNGLPCDPFYRLGCGLGITTGKANLVDSDAAAVNGGGIPVFKNNTVGGGIGVSGVPTSVAEFAAFVGSVAAGAAFGPVPASPGVIFLDGILLPFVEQTSQPPGTGPGGAAGSYVLGPFASPLGGAGVPDGWLVGPLSGSRLSAGHVEQIVNQAISQASITRAAIRLPLGSRTSMVIAVSDLDGSILGLYRMPDATVFSIDVAVAKARNVVYFSGPERTPGDLAGVPSGTAVTNRTISFGAQPFYPPGIDDSGTGPFFGLYLADTPTPCTQGSQPPNLNQNGIVFFPGSTAVYAGGDMVGGLGVSGDGVEQDDLVSAAGATNVAPPVQIRADQIILGGIRLPYFKFPRNPEE